MSAEEVQRRIASAVATDLVSGENQVLVQRGRCHFFKRFRAGPYDVQLRLDWNDIIHGFPRLDADFYDPEKGKLIKSMKGHNAHHTDAVLREDMQLYVWEYQDQELHLRIDLSWWALGSGHNASCGSGAAYVENPSGSA